MNNMRRNILLTIAMVAASALYAQKDSLNAVIQVENEYTPVVTKAAKKGFTPTTEENNTTKPLELEFSQSATPFKGFTGERDVNDLLPKQNGNYSGYARLGYGTGNNIDAKLSYLFNISEKDKLNAVASLEGFNSNINSPIGKWDSRFYSSWAGAEYSHKFDRMTLKSNVEFSDNVFNYNSCSPSDKQNVQKIHFGTSIASQLAGPFAYDFGVRFSRNHYKHTPFLWNYTDEDAGSFNENTIGADARLAYEFTNDVWRNVVMGITLNNYSYAGTCEYENVTELNLNPATNIKFENLNIRLGAQLNMQTRGAFLAIAPDIDIEAAISDKTTVYASIKGGREASSFETLELISPYWSCYTQPKPKYTIADITAGARISSNNLSADIFAGYAYTKNDLMGYAFTDLQAGCIDCTIAQENTTHAYIGARAGFDHEGWLKLSTTAKYNYWKCDTYSYLATRPEFEFAFNGEARPMNDIYISLTYSFATYAHDNASLNKNELNLRTSYKFANRFSAFVEGNNLLNRTYIKYAGYYEQGINALIGLSASF